MGKGVKVDWQESSEELKQLYQKEVHPQRRTRLQAFWQLSQGKRIQDVVDTTGASYRSMEQWLRWYRRGGLGEVLRRVVGHQAKGKKPYLNRLQQRALVAKVQLGQFRNPSFGDYGYRHGAAVLRCCIAATGVSQFSLLLWRSTPPAGRASAFSQRP